MARRAQAFGEWGRRLFLWRSLRVLLVAGAGLSLAACGARGVTLEDVAVDRSLVTGSVPAARPTPPDAAIVSDEGTIRNAVSSAIVEDIGGNGLGWANAYTGSRGTISNVVEAREAGILCRSFTASRESYAGIHMFRGETCLGPANSWAMTAFEAME